MDARFPRTTMTGHDDRMSRDKNPVSSDTTAATDNTAEMATSYSSIRRLGAGEISSATNMAKDESPLYYCSSCKRTQLHTVPQPPALESSGAEPPAGLTVDAIRVRHAYKTYGRRRKIIVMEDLNMTVNSGTM